jgi:cupin superfamily acireductone dioxygenase involved in methionine salvage
MNTEEELYSTARAPDENHSEHRLRSLTIRLEEETYKKLIAIAGEKSKAEYIRAVLVAHLSAPQEHRDSTAGEPPGILEAKIESLEELLKAKNENIKDLQNQVGFLTQDHVRISGQLDRLLMPSPQEIIKKNWWQFWK